MALNPEEAVTIIGLPVLQLDARPLGTVADACISEEGGVGGLKIRLKRKSGEYHLDPEQFRIASDSVISRVDRSEFRGQQKCQHAGIVGVSIRTSRGEVLGRVTNVVVNPESLNIVGLELSNGLMKDWASGRPLVILDPSEDLAEHHGKYIVLSDEAISVERADEASGEEESAVTGAPPPIDWDLVATLSVDEIRDRMADVVWERRGAPDAPGALDQYKEMTAGWAAELKQAAERRDTTHFDDLAMLTSDQVEALLPFRVGTSAIERATRSAAA